MCPASEEEKRKKALNKSGSPKVDIQAQQRKRILSPRRQKYEKEFEKYITRKNVEEKLEEVFEPSIDFDVTTKPEGTYNARVNQKLKFLEEEKKRAENDQMMKSLNSMEKDAEEVLQQEVIAIMAKDMLNKLKEVFDSCKERG